jgi:hypothetical protein
MNINDERKIHALVEYDTLRKRDGYTVRYRRWTKYRDIADIHNRLFGEHVETLYLHPTGKSLLVKVQPDGGISAFEAVCLNPDTPPPMPDAFDRLKRKAAGRK